MKRIEIKITEEIYKKMVEKQKSTGLQSMTDFILFCCLNSKINCNIGIKKDINEAPKDIEFAFKMLRDEMITKTEYDRIKSVIIANFEKSSVNNTEDVKC